LNFRNRFVNDSINIGNRQLKRKLAFFDAQRETYRRGEPEMFLKLIRFIAILFAAFSMSLSMAHLMEMPPRLQFDQELWVKVTVIEGAYDLFGSVGAVFEVGAILLAFILTVMVRKNNATFYWTLCGALALLVALISWIIFVADANAELAKWLTEPVPSNWTQTRNQWEYAHAVNAFIKIAGFCMLLMSVLVEIPNESSKVERTL
jgi:hypothetical protein